jgi:hypothetical protein
MTTEQKEKYNLYEGLTALAQGLQRLQARVEEIKELLNRLTR